MPSLPKRFVVSVVSLSAVFGLAFSACGGSGDDPAKELAAFMPPDSFVYVEAKVRPEGETAENVDSIAERLTGSTLGETIQGELDKTSDTGLTYSEDVEPWLGEAVAISVGGQIETPTSSDLTASAGSLGDASKALGSDSQDVGLVAQTTDEDAARDFIDKAAAELGDTTDGEYEGNSYKMNPDDGSVLGMVDGSLVFASSEAVFQKMVDAKNGDSLQGAEPFSGLVEDLPDGSLVDMYIDNGRLLDAAGQSAGLNALYEAMGVDLKDSGTIMSMVPEENQIAMIGSSSAESELESGDATPLIETFPANSVFAAGSGDVGANATKVLDAINQEGIEGALQPGELDQVFREASQGGVDLKAAIESLETVGIFISGDSVAELGGALVATTSDPEPLKASLGTFSTLLRQAQNAQVRPLGGGLTGFRVNTPELPGRPVVLAIKGDRMVLGIGIGPAIQALNGGGSTLADEPAFQAAADSLPGDGIDMFGNPAAVGALLREVSAGDPAMRQVADVMDKFEFMVSGSGEEDNSFEFNMGLQE